VGLKKKGVRKPLGLRAPGLTSPLVGKKQARGFKKNVPDRDPGDATPGRGTWGGGGIALQRPFKARKDNDTTDPKKKKPWRWDSPTPQELVDGRWAFLRVYGSKQRTVKQGTKGNDSVSRAGAYERQSVPPRLGNSGILRSGGGHHLCRKRGKTFTGGSGDLPPGAARTQRGKRHLGWPPCLAPQPHGETTSHTRRTAWAIDFSRRQGKVTCQRLLPKKQRQKHIGKKGKTLGN